MTTTTPQTGAAELLACRSCGEVPVKYPCAQQTGYWVTPAGFQIICQCGARGGVMPTSAEANRAWNARTPAITPASQTDADAGIELIAAVREAAFDLFGGNCTFVDDDLAKIVAASQTDAMVERIAIELVNVERVDEHNLPPIEWCELSGKDRRTYRNRAKAITAIQGEG